MVYYRYDDGGSSSSSMRIPFKLFKCQAAGCDKKATNTFSHGYFCDFHYNQCKESVKMTMQWIREQDEKWLGGELKERDEDLV